MRKNLVFRIANAASAALALLVNILAVTLPLNGQDTGEISDRFQVYFVPAGYVFSIWSVIFLGWIAFSIYQLLPAQADNPRLKNLGPWFAISGILNAGWLFAWHYNQFGLSVLIMIGLLASLILSYVRLDVGRAPASRAEKWCVDIPFSIYLGWISVATIANITSWLYFIGWNGFGILPLAWGVVMLVIASYLGALVFITRRDSGFLLVFAWAFYGIAVKFPADRLIYGTALSAAGLALFFAISAAILRRRKSQ